MIGPVENNEGRRGRSENGNGASPLVGVKAAKIAGTSAYVLRAKGHEDSAGAPIIAPADLKSVSSMAAEAGARLSYALPKREVVAFEALSDGTIAVDLADGSKITIASERHPSASEFPTFIIGAETFLALMGRFATLPLGASPVGRRFVRRSAIVDGQACVRYSEAGRDV